MRSEQIGVRLSPEAKKAATEAAASVGLDLGSWLRMRALEAARGKRPRLGQLDASTEGPPIAIRFEPHDAAAVREAAMKAHLDTGEFIRRAAAK